MLKLMLFWDPLRGDPSPRSRRNRPTDKKPPATLLILSRFQKLAADVAPKTPYK
jgi:hypothetical protein